MVNMAMTRSELSRLKTSLTLDLTPEIKPGLVPAAVLAPLYVQDEELELVFTQRTLTVKDHRGQISFPGGVKDQADPHLLATALRETREEIGLDPALVEPLGTLPPVATITGYGVVAYVGLIPYPYEFHLNAQEVERLLRLPLTGFYPPERWTSGDYHYRGRTTRVCYWRGNNEVIWGATARILLNLLAALGQDPIPGDKNATCLD